MINTILAVALLLSPTYVFLWCVWYFRYQDEK